MNPSEQQKVWAYLDKALSEQERKTFEEALGDDPALQRLLAEAKLVDRSLAGKEPDQPSLRFSTNLMDALPVRYQPITLQPLLSSKTRSWMAAGLAVLVILQTTLTLMLGPGTLHNIPGFEQFLSITRQIPEQWLQISFVIGVGYIGYLLLDYLAGSLFKRTL